MTNGKEGWSAKKMVAVWVPIIVIYIALVLSSGGNGWANFGKKDYYYFDEQSAIYVMQNGGDCEFFPSDDDDPSNDWRCEK